MAPAKDCPLLPQRAQRSPPAATLGRRSPVTTTPLKKPLAGPFLVMSPSSADAFAIRSFIQMAGLLPAPRREFLGALRSLGEGGGEGGTPRDSVVILFGPPSHPPLPPGLRGGQTLVNDDDSIIGACGGLGQTNAEQMPKEEGRRTETLPHRATPSSQCLQ